MTPRKPGRCPDCNQAYFGSFTVCTDGVVRCLDCGASTRGRSFEVSVEHSRRILKPNHYRILK